MHLGEFGDVIDLKQRTPVSASVVRVTITHICYHIVDDHPEIVRAVVLGNLISSKNLRFRHGLCGARFVFAHSLWFVFLSDNLL